MPRRRYIDEDATGSFLDKPPVMHYEGGPTREDAIRGLGLDPDDPIALDRELAKLGWSVPPLPPPVPK